MGEGRWHPWRPRPSQPAAAEDVVAAGEGPDADAWCRQGWLDDRDWQEITEFLGAHTAEAVARRTEAAHGLAAPIAVLREAASADLLPSARLTNDLLDLWAGAHAVDERLGEPVERLLSCLVGRQLVGGGELRAMCDELEELIASTAGQPGPLAEPAVTRAAAGGEGPA